MANMKTMILTLLILRTKLLRFLSCYILVFLEETEKQMKQPKMVRALFALDDSN